MSEYLEHITSVEDMKDKINDFALAMYNKGRADERAKVFDKIMSFINTSNRGNCDYFIIDQIENYINLHK